MTSVLPAHQQTSVVWITNLAPKLGQSYPAELFAMWMSHDCMINLSYGWLQNPDGTVLLVAVCRKFHRQAGAGYWQEGNIQWTERNSLVYPAVSSLAGLVAGMFGVGGGIVKVWDTLLLPLTLIDACGWHVWGRLRVSSRDGTQCCCPKPFLVHAAEGCPDCNTRSHTYKL